MARNAAISLTTIARITRAAVVNSQSFFGGHKKPCWHWHRQGTFPQRKHGLIAPILLVIRCQVLPHPKLGFFGRPGEPAEGELGLRLPNARDSKYGIAGCRRVFQFAVRPIGVERRRSGVDFARWRLKANGLVRRRGDVQCSPILDHLDDRVGANNSSLEFLGRHVSPWTNPLACSRLWWFRPAG